MNKRIYLDYNATAPLFKEVTAVLAETNNKVFGNPSSTHKEGRIARSIIENTRDDIASAIHADPAEIFFTGGGTESDNLAISGVVAACNYKNPHIITSAIEHYAVFNTCKAFNIQNASVTFIGCDDKGRIDPASLEKAIDDKTTLISIMHANNETGVIQPIKEIAGFTSARNIPLHCDAVQSMGKIPIDVRDMGVDLLSISAHKIGGPKGVGALYVKKGTPLSSVIYGGHQEKNIRPGTENVSAIAGFGVAVRIIIQNQDKESIRLLSLRNMLREGICKKIPDAIINGDINNCLPNTLNISFPHVRGEESMIALDLNDIAVSTGSACTIGAITQSHVLKAMGLDEVRIRSALRFSLGWDTSEDDILIALDIIPEVINSLIT